jgi:hypothetical protein
MKLAVFALVVLACGRIAAADPPGGAHTRDRDAEFRRIASAIAVRDDRYVVSWGTMRLEQTARPGRFAELAPVSVDGADSRGAYLIEQAGGARWLIAFAIRVRGFPAPIDAPRAPPWSRIEATAIHHDFRFVNGHEAVDFALRAGTPVVLRYEYDPDYAHETLEVRSVPPRGPP